MSETTSEITANKLTTGTITIDGWYCSCGAWVVNGAGHICVQSLIGPAVQSNLSHVCFWSDPQTLDQEGNRFLVQRCTVLMCNAVRVLARLAPERKQKS